MLIEFSVTNFRSIKEETRLSLVASRDKKHGDSNLVEPKLAEDARPIWLLRSAAIYGANAAGKTNLLRGLKTMRDIVLHSTDRLDELPVTPFRFDSECRNLPTSFEVICIADGDVRYQYGFSATPHEVTDEWLYVWPSGRMQVWFERSRSETSGEPSWKFGRKLTGDREVWRRATRPQALFLSTAISLNSTQLKPLYDWFRERLHVASVGGWSPSFSLEYCNKNRTDIVGFLTAADLAVTDIRIVEEDFSPEKFPELKDLDEKFPGEKTIVDVFLRHQPKGGKSAELEMAEESHGTQKMFALAGPWLDSLDKGNVIVFDELHDNLHPALVRFLINRFHDPEANPYGAQLIFSTHDTSILDRDVFRPDQIWFCERNEHLETRLFPLSDFRLRRSVEDLEKAYLAGRFGALPYIQGSGRQPSD